MFERRDEAIHALLRDRHHVAAAELAALEVERAATGRALADVAVERGLIEKKVLLRTIGEELDCAVLEEMPAALPGEAVELLPPALAQRYGVIPWRVEADGVALLAVDPFNAGAIEDLRWALGRDVRLVVAEPAEVAVLIRRHYETETPDLADMGAVTERDGVAVENPDALSAHDIEALAGQAPVVRFVNLVLGQAVRSGASDVHFEPFEREFKIRYRVDGALFEMAPPAKTLALAITSRLKVLANLNIAERRVPQDGRIRFELSGRTVDLRVSTLPTQFGESVVLRVLDASAGQFALEQLGLPDDILTGVRAVLRRPNGIFIVTGPTGSGKTTTLYSGLRLINTPDVKILTAEDPVEYEIEGLMQLPVNPTIGLTFAAALRSFLRQDPDVIMVGEIRDRETAQIAIQASLTGHLVLTTLHTNDAAGAVTRLVDMGVEPFLIASTVEAVLAQRLVRRICPACRAPKVLTPEMQARLGDASAGGREREFFLGRGCAACGGTGYRGRLGLFEWLPMTEAIRELVGVKASTQRIREAATAAGGETLREAGLRAAVAGLTTIDEVLKYT